MGTLKIKGRIELKQFWPIGKEDADTSQLKLKVGDAIFEYSPDNDYQSTHFQPTSVYDNAQVVNQSGKNQVVKYRNQVNRAYIKIRLQGLDAPELHYKIYDFKIYQNLNPSQKAALKAVNVEYRQAYAETSVGHLVKFLESTSPNQESLECIFLSQNIKAPADAIDVYGRFVGDIFIQQDGNWVSVNEWILSQGLAFPAFYNSMTVAEINRLTALSRVAEQKAKVLKNVWLQFSKKIVPFDFGLMFRENGTPDPVADAKAKVLFPKVYRRYCVYSILKKAILLDDENFTQYLKSKPHDKFIEIQDFLAGNMLEKPFSVIHDHGALEREPEAIVFVENPDMKLVDQNNVKITSF